MEADQALQALPGCSRYHVSRYLALSFLYMTGTWHVYAILFIGADPGHSCKSPAPNSTDASVYYPDGECHVTVQQEGQNHTEACPAGYVYGAEFTSTVLTEWDLVCDKDFMVDLSSTIVMIGHACGAALVTPFSDRFGRKWVLLISTWIQGVVGVTLAFVDNFVLFAVLRFFIGFLNMAIALVTYVMVTESFSAHHRTQPSIGVNISWALGLMMLALFGYLIRDWRHLQLLISVPKFITIFYICFLDESIPWLVAKGKYKQVEAVIRQAGRLNTTGFPSQSFHHSDETGNKGDNNHEDQNHVDMEIVHESETSESTLTGSDKDTKPCTVVDLFRTPKMRRYTLIMFYLWFVVCLGYAGILFSTPTLSGNMFLNLAISAAVEIPAVLVCMLVLEKVGRRKTMVVFLLICGVMNIVTIFVPNQTESGIDLGPLLIALAMAGKFGITGGYSTVYLYSAEIFPTILRNQAMGLSSFFENIGGISAPIIVYWAKNLSQMPLLLFGVLTLIGGVLAFFLPETHNRPLPETIADVEQYKKFPAMVNKDSLMINTDL